MVYNTSGLHSVPANSLDPYLYSGGTYSQQALLWWKARLLIMIIRGIAVSNLHKPQSLDGYNLEVGAFDPSTHNRNLFHKI